MENKEINLPAIVTEKLPVKAQEIYREAFAHVLENYGAVADGQREAAAHDAAMLRVSQQFETKGFGLAADRE